MVILDFGSYSLKAGWSFDQENPYICSRTIASKIKSLPGCG